MTIQRGVLKEDSEHSRRHLVQKIDRGRVWRGEKKIGVPNRCPDPRSIWSENSAYQKRKANKGEGGTGKKGEGKKEFVVGLLKEHMREHNQAQAKIISLKQDGNMHQKGIRSRKKKRQGTAGGMIMVEERKKTKDQS